MTLHPAHPSHIENGQTVYFSSKARGVGGTNNSLPPGSKDNPFRDYNRALLKAEELVLNGELGTVLSLVESKISYAQEDILKATAERDQEEKKRLFEQVLYSQGSFSELLFYISSLFLGTPYTKVVDHLIPWENPVFWKRFIRFDAVDCMSYAENVLALILARMELMAYKKPTIHDLRECFEKKIIRLMFPEGTSRSAISRHRYIEAEWAPANSYIVKEMTGTLSAALQTHMAVLDKRGLLLKQASDYARFFPEEHGEQIIRFYYNLTKQVHPYESVAYYLPLEEVIEHYSDLVAKAKEPYLVTMVSHRPDLYDTIGSGYNVTHMGFLFRREDKLILRHASSIGEKAVLDVDFKDYSLFRLSQRTEGRGLLGYGIYAFKQ